MSASPARQMAARIMLDLARSHADLAITPQEMERLRAEAGPLVAGEVDALMQDLAISPTSAE